MVKRRRQFNSLDGLGKALEHVAAHSPFGPPDTLDGLKWSSDSWWVQVRASNTEPIIRVFAEARSEVEADRLTRQILTLLNTTA
jgi:phosphomannomutase